MVEIKLSRLTQKIIGCEIGENVSTEYPWKFVKKEVIEDNLDLHCDSSEFFPIRDKIFKYPDENILIGYVSGNLNVSNNEDHKNDIDDDDNDNNKYGKFIMCLSESSRDLVIHQIEASRTENENRVKNYIYKTARYWRDLGSGGEIDETIVKNSRPFYEIEVNK